MSPNAAPAVKSASSAGKILAIDYGRVRIGLAIADWPHGLPQPLATLGRINRNEDMRRLRELAREHSVKLALDFMTHRNGIYGRHDGEGRSSHYLGFGQAD